MAKLPWRRKLFPVFVIIRQDRVFFEKCPIQLFFIMIVDVGTILFQLLELGQMVSISKYRDNTWYRYQIFKVSKYRLDSSIISLYLDIDTYFGI